MPVEPPGTVECETHGLQQETFVCQHIVQGLVEGTTHGFWCAEDSESPRPDAWCTACNEFLEQHGGDWNDTTEAFASVKLLCGACYDSARIANLGRK